MEGKREFGKAVAVIVVLITMVVLSFQRSNMTGAATLGGTYGEMFGGYAFLFLATISLLAIAEYALKRK